MLTVKLLRKIGVLEEEYGKIQFDGEQFYYVGLSSIFTKSLEQGFMGDDNKWCSPTQGIRFLNNLKNHFVGTSLRVTDIQNA